MAQSLTHPTRGFLTPPPSALVLVVAMSSRSCSFYLFLLFPQWCAVSLGTIAFSSHSQTTGMPKRLCDVSGGREALRALRSSTGPPPWAAFARFPDEQSGYCCGVSWTEVTPVLTRDLADLRGGDTTAGMTSEKSAQEQ